MQYTGLNLHEALALPCDMFMLCRKNAVIETLKQSEKGREYLQECEDAKHTKPDFAALHRLQGKLR